MTVLLPWPSPVSAPHRLVPDAAMSQAWRPVPARLKASAAGLPARAPAPMGAAGHFPLDLSALGKVRPAIARQALSLRAGMAELVLINRLRARTRRGAGVDVLEQAARVIGVTARSWLGDDLGAPASA